MPIMGMCLSSFVLLACVSLAAHTASPGRRFLPNDIAAWNRAPHFRNVTRWWSIEDLSPANQHMGSSVRARKLLDKLDSGQRIVVAAFGSSFVHDYAGCFDMGPESFRSLNIIPSPYTYPQAGQDWYAVQRAASSHGANKCDTGGFMQAFMHTINETWPHPGHVFLNNGKGGSSLEHLLEASCPSAYTPEDLVDIVLLDPATTLSSAASVEKLLRKYLRAKAEPVVIIVSNVRNCYGLHLPPSDPPGDPVLMCAANCLLINNRSACELLGPEPYPAEAAASLEVTMSSYQRLAAHYDVPHFNLFHLVRALMINENVTSRLGISSKWHLLGRLYMDTVHFQRCPALFKFEEFFHMANPSIKEVPPRTVSTHFDCPATAKDGSDGSLLVADILVNWLRMMSSDRQQQQQAPGAIRRRRLQLAREKPLTAASSEADPGQGQQHRQLNTGTAPLLPDPSLFPTAIHKHADEIYVSRCYGFGFDQLLGGTSEKNGSANLSLSTPRNASQAEQQVARNHAEESKQKITQVTPGDFFTLLGPMGQPGAGFQPLPPLNVTLAKRWQFVSYYRSSNGQIKFKPGYQTETAGSKLEIVVDTTFPLHGNSSTSFSPASLAPENSSSSNSSAPVSHLPQPEVVLTYTSSFDNWGTARISCISGCECAPVDVNAHSEGNFKHSLLKFASIAVTQHVSCGVQVLVLDPNLTAKDGSGGSGSKFKISAAMVRLKVAT